MPESGRFYTPLNAVKRAITIGTGSDQEHDTKYNTETNCHRLGTINLIAIGKRNTRMTETEVEQTIKEALELSQGGQKKEAIVLLEKTLSYQELSLGEEDSALIPCLEALVETFEVSGRHNDALRTNNRLLALVCATKGEVSTEAAKTLWRMAKISDSLSRQNEANSQIQRALDTAKQCMKQEDPLSQEIIRTYNYLINGVQPGLQAKDSNSIKSFSELSDHDQENGESKEEVTDFANIAGENFSASAAKVQEQPLATNTLSSLDSKGDRENTQSVEYAKILASRKRASSPGVRNLSALRNLKSLVVPLIGAVAVVALLVFILCRPKDTQTVVEPKVEPKTAIQKRFLTADAKKEIRLLNNNLCWLVSNDKATAMPYHEVQFDWPGLLTIMADSVTEKQIILADNKSILQSEDGLDYYGINEPEHLVIAKMHKLAGFAQTMYLSTGEYPQLVTNNIISQFTFENPVTKQPLAIPLKLLTANSFVGMDPETALASGLVGIDEKKPQPCGIACYTQVASVMDARGEKLKTVKFFLRGYDKNGQLLKSSIKNQVYVECASSLSLIDIGEQESKSKRKKKSTIQSPLTTLPVEPPLKPTSVWLVANPSIPTIWVHYALPLTLLATSILAFLASHLQGVNMKGQTVSSGSRVAHYFAVIALILALLSIARIYLLS